MAPALAVGILMLAAGLWVYPLAISAAYRWRIGQYVREEGPQRHLSKAGTPTAGGVIFVALGLLAVALFDREGEGGILALALALGALLGAFDDFQKLAAARNLGLKARLKAPIQLGVGLLLGYLLYRAGFERQFVPGLGLVDMGLWLVPLAALAVVATSNAVNLTDGSDGLAAGLGVMAFGVLAALAGHAGQTGRAAALAGLAGATLAFLWYNLHPARVFMGDTGSLALGTALAVGATEVHLLWLLPLLGLVFAIETLTVIVQVVAFKATGRRVFRMSPLHNHFDLLGWREERIAALFWTVGAVCAVLVSMLAWRNLVLR